MTSERESDWDDAMRALRAETHIRWGDGAMPADVAHLELVLGGRCPPYYARYLRELGWCVLGTTELYGLGVTGREAHLDVLQASLHVKRAFDWVRWPFAVIADWGTGDEVVVRLIRQGEAQSEVWELNHELRVAEPAAVTFEGWFRRVVISRGHGIVRGRG
jgi:hypothetical protein